MLYGREFKRFKCSGKVYLTIGNGQRFVVPASLLDAGVGGFRVQSSYALEVNRPVAFEIARTPGSRLLKGRGVIRHLRIAQAEGVSLCTLGVAFSGVHSSRVKDFLRDAAGVRPKPLLDARTRRERMFLLKSAPMLLLIGCLSVHVFCAADMQGKQHRYHDALFFDALISFLYRAE